MNYSGLLSVILLFGLLLELYGDTNIIKLENSFQVTETENTNTIIWKLIELIL